MLFALAGIHPKRLRKSALGSYAVCWHTSHLVQHLGEQRLSLALPLGLLLGSLYKVNGTFGTDAMDGSCDLRSPTISKR